MARKIGAVILAAGAGMRLGGVAKALLGTANGETFLERIVGTVSPYAPCGAEPLGITSPEGRINQRLLVVVGPPHGREVAALASDLGLHVVHNPQPERGMASSIALGFTAMAETDCDAAWLWPVDHPEVAPATLAALVAALGDHDAARPTVGGRGGHPPLVARALWPRLAGCASLPNGARDVFASADVIDVPVADRGCVRDIDTVLDLEVVR